MAERAGSDQLRERLLRLCDDLPDEVASASWLRDGRERWMVELERARDPPELAQCALALEKCVKRRAQPKWWRQERPIWVQGLLALARSSLQEGIAGCEPEGLLQQLVLTLSKHVRTLDLSALGIDTHDSADAAQKHAEELIEELRADERNTEVIHGDAPVCDFFMQRKRRRLLQAGDPLLPAAAVHSLQQLARRPTSHVLADLVLESALDDPSTGVSAWTRLLSARLAIVHGGIGTFGGSSEAGTPAQRPEVVCAPDSMRLFLDESTPEVPAFVLRAVCHKALGSLARADGLALFEVPIEEAIRSCPMRGYEARIRSKRLLDLGRIRVRVDAAEGAYASLAEFRQDVRDMFQNAIDYHGPRPGRNGAAGASAWIARLAAELHAHFERALPRVVEEVRPRLCSYLCPADALPRPWAVLELAHAAQKVVSSAGLLKDLPVTVLGEMRDACLTIMAQVQREVAERLRQA